MSESEPHEPEKARRAIPRPLAKARGHGQDAQAAARIPNAEAQRGRE